MIVAYVTSLTQSHFFSSIIIYYMQ